MLTLRQPLELPYRSNLSPRRLLVLGTPSTEAAFVSFDVDSSWVPVPSLRPYFYGGVPHTNVTQHNSTNDAVLKVVLLRRKVHEFLTLLNGTQDYAPHFMKHMLTG